MTRDEWDEKCQLVMNRALSYAYGDKLMVELFGERPGPSAPDMLYTNGLRFEAESGFLVIGNSATTMAFGYEAAVELRDWLTEYINWKEQA